MSSSGVSIRLAEKGRSISSDALRFSPGLQYGDNDSFIKLFVLSYCKFLYDSPLEGLKKPDRVVLKFLSKLCTSHVSNTIRLFSSYADVILSSEYSTGSDSSTRIFQPFMKDTPIFKEHLEWVRTGRPELLKYILSFLTFGKKLEYVDPEFDATAFRGWLEVEERLSGLSISDLDALNLKTIVSVILAPIDDTHLLPKFGPGKVSERGIADVFDKLEQLVVDPKLDYTFELSRNRSFTRRDGAWRFEGLRGDSELSSRLKFVPKDITKSRSICMEPNAYMYFQQEVHRYMRSVIERGLISRYVSIDDQTGNQYAAVHGSQYLSSDTIDLSSASDSVHVDLVRKIFPTSLLFYMMGTRTSSTYVPGSSVPVRLHKFAPMGSAVCFPTQCVIFTAVCIYAYIAVHLEETTGERTFTEETVRSFLAHHLHRNRSELTPFTNGIYEPPVVYGDDIICDSRVTDSVVSTLNRLGFAVNRSKSFTGSMSFRESCGVFSYCGQDVTPVRFRLPYFNGRPDAKVFSSFIGGINQMRQHGYNHVASFWLSVMKRWGLRNPLPFVTNPDSFGMFTLNKHRPSESSIRWNADWQTFEERIQGIGPRRVKKSIPNRLDTYTYDQWWRSKIFGGSLAPSGRGLNIRPQETGLRAVWSRLEM